MIRRLIAWWRGDGLNANQRFVLAALSGKIQYKPGIPGIILPYSLDKYTKLRRTLNLDARDGTGLISFEKASRR